MTTPKGWSENDARHVVDLALAAHGVPAELREMQGSDDERAVLADYVEEQGIDPTGLVGHLLTGKPMVGSSHLLAGGVAIASDVEVIDANRHAGEDAVLLRLWVRCEADALVTLADRGARDVVVCAGGKTWRFSHASLDEHLGLFADGRHIIVLRGTLVR